MRGGGEELVYFSWQMHLFMYATGNSEGETYEKSPYYGSENLGKGGVRNPPKLTVGKSGKLNTRGFSWLDVF